MVNWIALRNYFMDKYRHFLSINRIVGWRNIAENKLILSCVTACAIASISLPELISLIPYWANNFNCFSDSRALQLAGPETNGSLFLSARKHRLYSLQAFVARAIMLNVHLSLEENYSVWSLKGSIQYSQSICR